MSLLFCCRGEGWGWIESWVGTADEVRLPVAGLGHINLLSSLLLVVVGGGDSSVVRAPDS